MAGTSKIGILGSGHDPQELDRALQSFRDKPVVIQSDDGDLMTDERWLQRWAEELPNNRLILILHSRHFTFDGAPKETVENFRSWSGETFTVPSICASVRAR